MRGRVKDAGDRELGHLSARDVVAYAESSADPEHGERLLAHVAACPDCARRVSEFQSVGAILRRRYPLVDDRDARRAILARTSRSNPRDPASARLDRSEQSQDITEQQQGS
jgi:anti-sigma factor ChrR (cupin superfamily)